MLTSIPNLTEFLLHLDELKAVERQSYTGGGARRENSAEHSWHLALACWSIAESVEESFDMEKLLKLALVHDLGEIGAGDTMLYSEARGAAPERERESLVESAAHPGNGIRDLVQLWDEQEAGESREAALLKVADRLLPFLLNINSEGRAWINNGISKSQVLEKHAFIKDEFPEIWDWVQDKVDFASAQGWLKAS